ncbi:hypothetical protein BaRGS_00019061 [Batillaria attramentaria]|uniref:Uncharacterized protein n=1 Tax=Batillaria attramentaria TaxID=370345 RepID=A0ABD0KRP6_9CAEN
MRWLWDTSDWYASSWADTSVCNHLYPQRRLTSLAMSKHKRKWRPYIRAARAPHSCLQWRLAGSVCTIEDSLYQTRSLRFLYRLWGHTGRDAF